MYRQTMDHIKVVVIPLDGTILDLNRFRYNYYHHLCEKYQLTCTKYEFYFHLSNMFDMYEGLPLSKIGDIGPLNARIERELIEYLSLKSAEPKKGFLELLEYLHQKNIQVAVMSTHRTKDTVHYLKMIHIYNKVQFIIGSDSRSLPLPSTQILETIQNHFQVQNDEVLVISSFQALNIAAHQLEMNIIYCEDLVEAGEQEKKLCYKCVKDLFEVLNILLFDRYEEVDMYSPILGMNDKMTQDELDDVRDKLQDTYKDDPKIVNLIDQTYIYHINQLNHQENISSNIEKIQNEDMSTISNEQTQCDAEDLAKVDNCSEENHKIKRFFFDDDVPIHKDNERVSRVHHEEIAFSEHLQDHIERLNEQEELELTQLLSAINKTDNLDNQVEKTEEQQIDESNEIKEKRTVKKFFEQLLNNICISFVILFGGIFVYVIFIYEFDNPSGIFRILSLFYYMYLHVVQIIFKNIFDSLHYVFHFLPNFNDYYYSNPLFSRLGVDMLSIFIFQFIIMSIFTTVVFFIKRGIKHEEYVDED